MLKCSSKLPEESEEFSNSAMVQQIIDLPSRSLSKAKNGTYETGSSKSSLNKIVKEVAPGLIGDNHSKIRQEPTSRAKSSTKTVTKISNQNSPSKEQVEPRSSKRSPFILQDPTLGDSI